jgi:hypothetical protein
MKPYGGGGKILEKDLLKRHGMRMPDHILIEMLVAMDRVVTKRNAKWDLVDYLRSCMIGKLRMPQSISESLKTTPRPQRDQILSIPGLKKVSMTVAAKMKKQFRYKKTFRGHPKKTTITNQEPWILQVLHLALEVEIEKWD